MKKLFTIALAAISIVSCKDKKENNDVPRSDNPSAEVNKQERMGLDTYNGDGTFNPDGDAVYNVSLPEDLNSNYTFKEFNIENRGIFIYLKTKDNIGLTNNSNNSYSHLFHIDKYSNSGLRNKYDVILFHDDENIKDMDIKRATVIYDSIDKLIKRNDSLVFTPKRFGNGVLSLQ